VTFSEHAEKVRGAAYRLAAFGDHLGGKNRADLLASLTKMELQYARAVKEANSLSDRGDFLIYRNEYEQLRAFVAEMSGLISDMDDVPDPGLDDLRGMAETIRREYELAVARVDERGERMAEFKEALVDALQRAERAEATLAAAREALEMLVEHIDLNGGCHRGCPEHENARAAAGGDA